jgi:hypothetical protein
MVSFQPVAHVGRTEHALPAVTVDELWIEIDHTLSKYGAARRRPPTLMFGHPHCTRIELFAVYERAGGEPCVVPIVRDGHDQDMQMMREFFERGLGGLNFRDDSMLERLCRAAGVLLTDPRWVMGPLRRWTLERLADVGTSAARLAWDIARRFARIDGFSVVSHHFMSAAELATDTGRDRLAACVFRVPVGDDMMPMCRVNAAGVRDAIYSGRFPMSAPVSHASSSPTECR